MSRTYIYICNRCGKEFEKGGFHFPKEITEEYTNETVDFCDECADGFRRWLNEGKQECK